MKIRKFIYLCIIFIAFSCINNQKSSIPVLKNAVNYTIGSAENLTRLYQDSLYSSILKTQFSGITAENLMKMKAVYIKYDSLDFSKTDSIIDFCKINNLRLHGHCFVWHSSIPRWMKEIRDSAKLENLLKYYISAYGQHCNKNVASWDVVNEAISDSAGLIRVSQFTEVLGNDFVARMFKYADSACPDAKLFYNEYCTEYNDVKLDSVLSMIKSIKDRGIRLDGIGFQMHTMLDTPDIETFKAALKKAVDMGLLIHISELDVSINKYNEDPVYFELNDSLMDLQKNRYKEIAMAYNEVVPEELRWGITLWGFHDKYNWVPKFYKRPDWPCILDSNYNFKPAFYGFYEGLKGPSLN